MNFSNEDSDGKKPQAQQSKSLPEHADIAARWIVDIIALPASFAASVLGQFTSQGGSGTRILGALGFFTGTLLSTDGIWQTMFQGVPLFPWFESSWIGWGGWLTLPFNPLFLISVGMSALIQVMEARTLRGKEPTQAKSEFQESTQFTLPAKPANNIDLTKALWGDYKRAGMRERHTGGGIALFFWVFDIWTTFAGRFPFRYRDPGTIMACLAYNFVTMMAGEIGWNIWKLTKK